MLGASWSPNAARTTSQAAVRSARSAVATYTVVLATSAREAPAAASAVTRFSITRTAWPGTSSGGPIRPSASSGQAPAVNTSEPAVTTEA